MAGANKPKKVGPDAWIWVCPKCGNQGKGSDEIDATKRLNRHRRVVHHERITGED